MKIGDYVRTINGKIWIIKSQQAISGHKKDIIKSSPNIIDLIEVGDYVNGMKVDHVFPPLKIFIDGEEYLEDEIETIVTREQFEAIKYEIK